MGGLLHLVQRGRGPILAAQNVTANPSTASVRVTVLLQNGALLYGYNVPVKGSSCCIIFKYNPGAPWFI